MIFRLDGAIPSKANRYRIGRHGMFKDRRVETWETAAVAQLKRLRKRHKLCAIVGPVSVDLVYVAPNRRADLAGIEKGLCDVLQGYAYANDKQIERLTLIRAPFTDKHAPRCYVRVESLVLHLPDWIPLTEQELWK